MSTELATTNRQEMQVAPADSQSEQYALLKRTICKNASDDELRLFVATAKRMGLDPFSGQIHGLMRWDSQERRNTLKIQVGIDGFRLVADRTGERSGEDDAQWCGENGQWVDVWPPGRGHPHACRVRVYRKGHDRPYTGIAYWNFYAQLKRDGSPNHMWQRGGPNMLAKCAEALALRKAFPAELSGLYTSEEMGQADNATASATEVRGQQVDDPLDYRIPYGKNKGRALRELKPEALAWYAEHAQREEVKHACQEALGALLAEPPPELQAEIEPTIDNGNNGESN